MLFLPARARLYFSATLLLLLSGNASAAEMLRINTAPNGAQSNTALGDVASPSISADSRYIAFSSNASNLITGDNNEVGDIFVYDRLTQKTERVSIDSNGLEGNKLSGEEGSSISADGRYVAFASEASNLIVNDTNKVRDIFVHNRLTHQTERVSIASNNSQANGESIDLPRLSADGRYVVFVSAASNLVVGDTNGVADVFVHDRIAHRTERVNLHSNGRQSNDFMAQYSPGISANGRYVVFSSNANNLVAKDTNKVNDIFVHDRITHKTERVSVSSIGQQTTVDSLLPGISANGRYVGFVSAGRNLVPQDSNSAMDVFLHDRMTHKTERVSRNLKGVQGNDSSGTSGVSLSASGRYIAFNSSASNLVTNDTNNAPDFFVYDRITHKTDRVSLTSTGKQSPATVENLAAPSLNADGRYVTFTSDAPDLVPEDSNEVSDVFLYDRLLDTNRQANLQIAPARINPTVLARNTESELTYNITNKGPNVVRNLRLLYLTSGNKPISITSSQGSCTTPDIQIICGFGGLSVGRSMTVTVTVKPQSNVFTQQFSVSDIPVDNQPSNNFLTISLPVRDALGL